MSSSPLPPPPGAPAKSGVPIVVIVLVVVVIVVFVLGVLAAIAIPSFVKYTRRAKAAEAETNVTMLGQAIVSRYEQQGALPAPLPATPAPGCQRRPWPADAAPGWSELGFAPSAPLYYSYSIEPMPGGIGVWARAEGDLDCDGVFSHFERSVTVGADRRPVVGPLIRTDETE